jgi:hypothetical protein
MCTAAMRVNSKKGAVERARRGPLLVDKAPTVAVLGYAIAAGFSLGRVDRESRLGEGYCQEVRCRGRKIHRFKRDAVLRALRALLAAQRERLDDLEAAIDYAENRQEVPAGFDPGPLREALSGRMNGCLSSADRQVLYRGRRMQAERVERICAAAGLDPESVYGDAWWGLEEVG